MKYKSIEEAEEIKKAMKIEIRTPRGGKLGGGGRKDGEEEGVEKYE